MLDIAELSKEIAAELGADLKSAKLVKVGIEEVRAAINAKTADSPLDTWTAQRLEERILRDLIFSI